MTPAPLPGSSEWRKAIEEAALRLRLTRAEQQSLHLGKWKVMAAVLRAPSLGNPLGPCAPWAAAGPDLLSDLDGPFDGPYDRRLRFCTGASRDEWRNLGGLDVVAEALADAGYQVEKLDPDEHLLPRTPNTLGQLAVAIPVSEPARTLFCFAEVCSSRPKLYTRIVAGTGQVWQREEVAADLVARMVVPGEALDYQHGIAMLMRFDAPRLVALARRRDPDADRKLAVALDRLECSANGFLKSVAGGSALKIEELLTMVPVVFRPALRVAPSPGSAAGTSFAKDMVSLLRDAASWPKQGPGPGREQRPQHGLRDAREQGD